MKAGLSVLCVIVAGVLACGCAEEMDALLAPCDAGSLFCGEGFLYLYTARDSSGELLRGVLRIAVDDSGRITGTWQLEQVRPTTTAFGPQTGEGELVGMIAGAEFWINLHPQSADNNVFLRGTYAEGCCEGVWEYVGFPGVLGRGTFQAWKVEE